MFSNFVSIRNKFTGFRNAFIQATVVVSVVWSTSITAQTYPNPSSAASAITMRLVVSGGNSLPAGTRLAMVPFLHEDGSVSRFSRHFAGEMTNSIRNTGRFTPVERAQLELILQEIIFSYSGMVDNRKAIDIGKLQGVQAMILGEFAQDGEFLSVQCRMVVVETGAVVASSSTRIRISQSMRTMMAIREPKPTEAPKTMEVPKNNEAPKGNETPKQNSSSSMEKVHSEFTEEFFGGKGFRYKVRNVDLNSQGKNSIVVGKGAVVSVSMDILHDCSSCGSATNQIIVGLGGEPRAQVSVWNGGSRSGGSNIKGIVGAGNVFFQNQIGSAEWVKVFFKIQVPRTPGIYYLRSRYAQHHFGKLLVGELKDTPQLDDSATLGWWTIDRPQGPGAEANIGAFIVE